MRKPRLLIVDDEIPFTTNLLKLLSRKGYEVSAVNDGYSALSIIEEQEFDVVILDQKMPGIDGVTTLKELKKKRPHLEVIMLTGHGSIESGVQGLQLGAFNYVMKPITFPELLEQIVHAYERKVIEEERSQE
ncbi:MAG: response regulator [Desulfomonile sp.]|jgi:DNA-binding NtrC family response regulator